MTSRRGRDSDDHQVAVPDQGDRLREAYATYPRELHDVAARA